MVWNSLALSSIPAAVAMVSTETSVMVRLGLVLSLPLVSYAMYNCLVNYTGAKPSEHYSVTKRPQYKQYQQSVNMFFPSPFQSKKLE